MPRRTRLPSLCSAKRSRSASVTPAGSVTSPSWKASGASGAVAAAVRRAAPLLRTSATPMLPASISRPTSEASFVPPRLSEGSLSEGFFSEGGRRSASIPACIDQSAAEPLPPSTKNSNLQALFHRLAPDDPGGFFRRDEARRLDVLEPAVVVVALQVAAAAATRGA